MTADDVAAGPMTGTGESVHSFGVLVKSLREAARLTQGDVAAFMGMSKNGGRVTVSHWETEQRLPSEAQVLKLAACLGLWPIASDPTIRRQIVDAALRESMGALRDTTPSEEQDD